MLTRHVYLYLGSKLFAAVLNLAAMALFVRMAGAEAFGAYVIQFSAAYIAYGVAAQWMRFAFFNGFEPERPGPWIASYLAAAAAASGGVAALALMAVALGLAPAGLALGATALALGLALYEAFHEVGRTRLHAERVAVGAVARAVLMLGLGVAALQAGGGATALAVAVGLAHLLAALPLLPSAREGLAHAPGRAEALRLWRYGRPLIASSGLNMANGHMERLLLARIAGMGAVGPYGAASDFVRQGMVVISEAIAGAYMPHARRALAEGRHDDASAVVKKAFLAFVALAAFGAAAVAQFDTVIFTALFGAEIAAMAAPAALLIALANAAMVIRLYYFGQVVFLTEDARLRLISEIAHFAVTLALGLALIPQALLVGAAGALLAGHLAGAAVYAWAWRRSWLLDLPYGEAARITGLALLAYLAAGVLTDLLGGVGVALGFFAFAAAGLEAAWRHDILSARELLAVLQKRLRLRAEG